MLSLGQLRHDGLVIDGMTDQLIIKATSQELTTLNWISKIAVFQLDNLPQANTLPPPHTPTPFEPSIDDSEDLGEEVAFMTLSSPQIEFDLMHRRLMHAGLPVVLKACKDAGISMKQPSTFHCESCSLGKSTQLISREQPIKATRPLALLHVDTIEHKPIGYKGFKYSMHFVDSYSAMNWITFLQDKSQGFQKFLDFLTYIENQTQLPVQAIGLDEGTEFSPSELRQLANQKGISLRTSAPATPAQNRRSERARRSITQRARTALIDAQLPEYLWPLAEDSAVRIINLTPSNANPDLQSPHERFAKYFDFPTEVWTPHIRHIRTWGCTAYVHIKSTSELPLARKMLPRAKKGVLVGYKDTKGKIYLVYIPKERRVVTVRDVRFHEGLPQPETQDDIDISTTIFIDPNIIVNEDT